MHRIETRPREFIGETTGHINRVIDLGFVSKEHLLNYLKGKKVLDLGSGAGLFAKQIYSLLDETVIISMNPRLHDSFYTNQHAIIDQEIISGKTILHEINPTQYQNGIKKYNETAIAANWNHLPFASESFDAIFATGSFLFYHNTYDKSVLSSLIKLTRKNGGEIRIETYDEGDEIRTAINLAKQMRCEARYESTSSGGYLMINRGSK